jgi:hypothetical protein
VTGSRRMPGANAQTRRFTSILPTNIMTLGALARLFEPSRDRQEAPPRMPLVFSSVALPPGRGSAPCAVCGCFRRRRAPASKWICWRKRRSLLGLMPRNLYRRVEVLFSNPLSTPGSPRPGWALVTCKAMEATRPSLRAASTTAKPGCLRSSTIRGKNRFLR